MFFTLEFARELSLKTQKLEQNLISAAGQIEVTSKWYRKICGKYQGITLNNTVDTKHRVKYII